MECILLLRRELPFIFSLLTRADCVFRVALVCIILETTFFQDKFGVTLATNPIDHNDPQLHMIVYLQVAIISQALIFVTRSHGFFFMERPSVALMCAFCVAQLISSIIAAYGDWGFTKIQAISGGWIGIVWVWVS